MSSEPVIQVTGLAKRYRLWHSPSARIKAPLLAAAAERLHRRGRLAEALWRKAHTYFEDFYALRDVSFSVNRGEVIGIIGRNGSGKSTLLQILAGTLQPSQGTVQVKGRVSAILELGTGFNAELTGRENVRLTATVQGVVGREQEHLIARVAEFAGIAQFFDQPVRNYSSGMFVRLAFACAISVDPDILIVDEALAVGDAKFQAKCFEHLRQLKNKGASILLVTHSTEQIVIHCSRALLLDQGAPLLLGEPRSVANRYMDLLFGKERVAPPGAVAETTPATITPPAAPCLLSTTTDVFATRSSYNQNEYRWGDGTVAILDYYLEAGGQPYPSEIDSGQTIRLCVAVRFDADIMHPIFGLTVKTKEGVTVYGVNSEALDGACFQQLGRAKTTVQVDVEFSCRLAPGDYFLSLGIATRQGEEVIPHDRRYDSIHVVVRRHQRFFGLADLDLTLRARQITP